MLVNVLLDIPLYMILKLRGEINMFTLTNARVMQV